VTHPFYSVSFVSFSLACETLNLLNLIQYPRKEQWGLWERWAPDPHAPHICNHLFFTLILPLKIRLSMSMGFV